jgi:hypothetical protein
MEVKMSGGEIKIYEDGVHHGLDFAIARTELVAQDLGKKGNMVAKKGALKVLDELKTMRENVIK